MKVSQWPEGPKGSNGEHLWNLFNSNGIVVRPQGAILLLHASLAWGNLYNRRLPNVHTALFHFSILKGPKASNKLMGKWSQSFLLLSVCFLLLVLSLTGLLLTDTVIMPKRAVLLSLLTRTPLCFKAEVDQLIYALYYWINMVSILLGSSTVWLRFISV